LQPTVILETPHMLLAQLDGVPRTGGSVLGKEPSIVTREVSIGVLIILSQHFISDRHLLPTLRIIFMHGYEPR
jgi:hypothetical protein